MNRGNQVLRWTDDQRRFVAERVGELANIAAGAMVFGQFLGDRPFSMLVGSVGMGAWIVLFVLATALAGRTQR